MIPMKHIMLAAMASVGLMAAAPVMAQSMSGTSQPPMPGDPNGSQPTGQVPRNTGMAPAPAGVPHDPSAPVGTSANPVTVGGNMTPPPTEAKRYPLCGKGVQDGCVNPGEARKKAHRTG